MPSQMHFQVEKDEASVPGKRNLGKLGRGHLAFALVGTMLVGIAVGVTLAHDSHPKDQDVKIPINVLIPAIVASDAVYPSFAPKLVALVNEFPVPDEVKAVEPMAKIQNHALAFIPGPAHGLKQGFLAAGGAKGQPAAQPTVQRGSALAAEEDALSVATDGEPSGFVLPKKINGMRTGFGGNEKKYTKDFSFKIAIGHVIPAVATVGALYPSFAPKLTALLEQYPVTVG
jgi:hypothetical protein